MTSAAPARNAFTDAPGLHPNLILGSLQLLFWLFFHPSAWRNHVARIDSALSPDFALVELKRAHWRNPNLRRLLITGYLVWPLMTGILIGLALWASGQPGESVAFGVEVGVAAGLALGLALGLAGSVAGGVAAGLTLGLAAGLVVGKALAMAAGVVAGQMGGVAAGLMGDVAVGVGGGLALGLAGGVAGGVAAGVVGSIAVRSPTFGPARQLGSMVLGIVVGVGMVGVVALAVAVGEALGAAAGNALVVAAGEAAGVALGAALGMAVGVHTRKWKSGLAFGVAGGVAFGVAGGVAVDVAFGVALVGALTGLAGHPLLTVAGVVALGVALGILTASLFSLPFVVGERVGGTWAGSVAGALVSGGFWLVVIASWASSMAWIVLGGLLGIGLGLTQALWRPLLFYPLVAAWNTLLYRADQRRPDHRPILLRRHSAFWDEHQRLRLAGLDEHLVLVAERDAAEAVRAMAYLATGRQRWAAQAAQVELDARRLERCNRVEAIGQAHYGVAAGELEGAASALLRSFSRISQDVEAALRQESSYNQRLALRAVEDDLDGLLRELTRSSDRYAVRFTPIATQWRGVVTGHVRELAAAVEQRQEIDSPYVTGVPLSHQQEIFVGRTDIGARIEQLLLDRRRPPLLLYGQRRTGKTSLLNNLGRLLPNSIVPLFVDLQGPAAQASDHAGFLYNLARGMVDSAQRERGLALPPLERESLTADPFTRFDEWLGEVERALGRSTALLSLDEFEALDRALTQERFNDADVLGMLRNLIQHRPRFKVLLAGSHTLEELERWAGYLINVQVVHIGCLKEDEARKLVEQPVMDFALRYESDASQRVLDLTRCHPFLVQLLCGEIVALKNEQEVAVRRLARLPDVEAAASEALSHGSFFFADIERNQVDADGLALLRALAAQGEGAAMSREQLTGQLIDPGRLERSLASLIQRELIEPVDGGYRFQVELIRRWFAQKRGV